MKPRRRPRVHIRSSRRVPDRTAPLGIPAGQTGNLFRRRSSSPCSWALCSASQARSMGLPTLFWHEQAANAAHRRAGVAACLVIRMDRPVRQAEGNLPAMLVKRELRKPQLEMALAARSR